MSGRTKMSYRRAVAMVGLVAESVCDGSKRMRVWRSVHRTLRNMHRELMETQHRCAELAQLLERCEAQKAKNDSQA